MSLELGAENVVFLASFPRSGNTLFRQVLEQCYNLPTYTIYRDEQDIGLWPRRWWPSDAKEGLPYYFIKTHRLQRHEGRTIWIVRDGRDVALSLWNYLGKHLPLDFYISDGQWSAHCEWYAREQATLVYFEDMLADPFGAVADALERAEIQLDKVAEPMLTSFDLLHASRPNFWRSGKVGQWREDMTPEQNDWFWYVNREGMELLGYGKEGGRSPAKHRRGNRRDRGIHSGRQTKREGSLPAGVSR